MVRTTTRGVTLALLIWAAAGCGGGTKRDTVNLVGKVTFKGQPVPAGFINFTPDVPGGNSGEVKGFPIVNGLYDTAQGDNPGIYAGANMVQISGFDGKAQKLWPQGKQIFNPVELKEDVRGGAKDFQVPDAAGRDVRVVPTADSN